MNKELIEQLRTQADEIASAGHAGWGNTMREAADELERIDAERGRPALGYDAIFKSIASATKAPGAPAGIEVSVRAFKEAIGGEIFLSATTITLTDDQIDIGIREAEKKDGDCDPTDFEREVKFCEKANGIAAAQGERK